MHDELLESIHFHSQTQEKRYITLFFSSVRHTFFLHTGSVFIQHHSRGAFKSKDLVGCNGQFLYYNHFYSLIIKSELNPICSFDECHHVVRFVAIAGERTSHSSPTPTLAAQHGHRCAMACCTVPAHPTRHSHATHTRTVMATTSGSFTAGHRWLICNCWIQLSHSVSNFHNMISSVNKTATNLLNVLPVFFMSG